ncbi:hypothetical protein MASR2M8_22340 [Opitutaceae bacterium]
MIGGGIVIGAGLAFGALLLPGVQGWLVKQVIARQPGWKVEFEHFGVGADGLDARGVAFAMPGLTATSEPIAVRVWPSRLLRRELHVEQVDVQKLRIELTPAQLESGAATTGAAEPFPGLLALLTAPLPWVVGQTRIEAQLVVNDGGQSVVVGDFTLQGGELRAGRAGVITYTLDVASALLPAGPDNRVRSRGEIEITRDAARGVERIAIRGDLRLPVYGPLTLPAGDFDLTISATPDGETYAGGLRLGPATTLALAGELKRSLGTLATTLDLRTDDTLVASLTEGHAPTGQVSATLAATVHLATTDIDATLQGDLTARDWARLRPELAPIPALASRLVATFARRGSVLELKTLDARLDAADASGLTAQVTLAGPVDLAQPTAAPRFTLRLAGLPPAWANPWLGSAIQVEGEPIAGAWQGDVRRDGSLDLTSTQPLRIGPLQLTGPGLPALPALTLEVPSRVSLANGRVTLDLPATALTSAWGDRVDLTLEASHELVSGDSRLTGHLNAALPTVLTGPDRPLPFTLVADWQAALRGDGAVTLEHSALELRLPDRTKPAIALTQREPIARMADGVFVAPNDRDLLTLEADALPLGWVSRWLPGYDLDGIWTRGASTLRSPSADRGLELTTSIPWRFTGLRLGVGGKELFRGEAGIDLDGAFSTARVEARLGEMELADANGNRITGALTLTATPADKRFQTVLEADAELPALPHSAGTFGAVSVRLRTRASSVEGEVAQVESFHLEARNADGPLLTIAAPQPFYYFTKPSGELILSSVAPLTLEIAPLPLAWFQPLLPTGDEIEGRMEAMSFMLVAEPQKFLLRPTKPVQVTNLSYRQRGQPRLVAATGRFFPGFDLNLLHELRPAFQLGYTGRLHATDGVITVGGTTGVEFETGLSFIGNDRAILPQTIDVATRLDFGALHAVPALAEAGMPAGGTLITRISGDPLGPKPLEVWLQIADLRAAGSTTPLPTLTVAASGQSPGQSRALRFDVKARLDGRPQPSDLAFTLSAEQSAVDLSFESALTSTYLDLAAFEAFAAAFTPPAAQTPPPAPAAVVETAGLPVATARLPLAPPLGVPFWDTLRGRFTLDLGSVRYAPYRIDAIRGRLELDDRTLALRNLTGTMFAGTWTGDLEVAYDPSRPEADHTLTAEFKIAQFETAQAIQTVFPNEYGSIDTRLNLDTTIKGSGNRWWEIMDRTEGSFTLSGKSGVVRLTHPQAGSASTVLALAGAVGFSPELRALGRLLKAFSAMPLDEVRVEGARDIDGNLSLAEFRIDSPQARLRGTGRVPVVEGVPLAGRALSMQLELQARDEVAVILNGMKLLEKQPMPDGYRRLNQPVQIGGEVGRPDPSPLYDLLARAVDGSGGTWGLIMRKVQREVDRQAAKPTR